MESKAVYDSEIGKIEITCDEDSVTRIAIVQELSNNYEKTAMTDEVYEQISEYLNGRRQKFDFKYKLIGTQFQRKVWEELTKIPYGETRSYKEIAEAIESPSAARAVGMANNKNPIMIAVPCHRVIGADGKMVGYAAGLAVKSHLLKLEADNK